MSRSRKDGHGRCTRCGDAGACRRKREALEGQQDIEDAIDEAFAPMTVWRDPRRFPEVDRRRRARGDRRRS